MTPLLFVAVVLTGGLGAALRYAVDAVISRLQSGSFPWGILAVNVSGSFALGLLTALAPPAGVLWVLGVGLLGGYTTFSAVAVGTVLLAEERRAGAAAAYAIGTLVATVAAAALGLWVGAA